MDACVCVCVCVLCVSRPYVVFKHHNDSHAHLFFRFIEELI